jgi:hypothetical protein
MKYFFMKIVILVGVVFILAGCYPGGAEYTSDTDIVITDYDQDYNFKSISTYYLADSINHIVEEGKTPNYSLDGYILGELERNLDALGWTRIVDSTSNQPDVAIVVASVKVTNYNYYTMPWYPGWGWGWYWKSTDGTQYWGYPGYGWYYPPYYGGYYTSYETGTLAWNLFDPDLVDETNEDIYIQWVGAINGVLGSSTSNTKNRITVGIDQAFRQSSYLSE